MDDQIEQQLICRACLKILENKTQSYGYIEDATGNLKDMLMCCVPEMDIYVSSQPIICFPCIQVLITVYNFKTRCLNTETVIRNYLQRNNLVEYNNVNLSCVVQELIRLNHYYRDMHYKKKQEAEQSHIHNIKVADQNQLDANSPPRDPNNHGHPQEELISPPQYQESTTNSATTTNTQPQLSSIGSLNNLNYNYLQEGQMVSFQNELNKTHSNELHQLGPVSLPHNLNSHSNLQEPQGAPLLQHLVNNINSSELHQGNILKTGALRQDEQTFPPPLRQLNSLSPEGHQINHIRTANHNHIYPYNRKVALFQHPDNYMVRNNSYPQERVPHLETHHIMTRAVPNNLFPNNTFHTLSREEQYLRFLAERHQNNIHMQPRNMNHFHLRPNMPQLVQPRIAPNIISFLPRQLQNHIPLSQQPLAYRNLNNIDYLTSKQNESILHLDDLNKNTTTEENGKGISDVKNNIVTEIKSYSSHPIEGKMRLIIKIDKRKITIPNDEKSEESSEAESEQKDVVNEIETSSSGTNFTGQHLPELMSLSENKSTDNQLEDNIRARSANDPAHYQFIGNLEPLENDPSLHHFPDDFILPENDSNIYRLPDHLRPNSQNNPTNYLLSDNLRQEVYECDNCTFVTTHLTYYNEHKKNCINDLDKNEKKCPHCPHVTNRQYALNKHINTMHTKAFWYSCDHCNYKSTDTSCLRRHKRNSHPEIAGSEITCKFCQFKCSTEYNLRKHMLKHDENPYLQCQFCSYSTKDRSNFRKHIFIHSPKPKECDFCDYKCVSPYQMKQHLKKYHHGVGIEDIDCRSDYSLSEVVNDITAAINEANEFIGHPVD